MFPSRALSSALTLALISPWVSSNSHAFAPCTPSFARGSDTALNVVNWSPTAKAGSRSKWAVQNKEIEGSSFLLEDFTTASGELVDPYQVLRVSRTADYSSIKQKYRELSRRYHPDMVRHRAILPGSCDNLDDVRDEWERIKLSYEILSDKKMRQKFDRNSAVADPGAAIARAALGAAGWGLAGVGKGLFKVGEVAFNQLANNSNNEVDKN